MSDIEISVNLTLDPALCLILEMEQNIIPRYDE